MSLYRVTQSNGDYTVYPFNGDMEQFKDARFPGYGVPAGTTIELLQPVVEEAPKPILKKGTKK